MFYLGVEYSSSVSCFLRNKANEQIIKNILSSLVQTPPIVAFHCECYHLRKRRRGFRHRHSPPKKGKAIKKKIMEKREVEIKWEEIKKRCFKNNSF